MTADRTIHAADLFCGAGGSSSGLARACEDLGIKADLFAVNHWDVAVATHTQNHPWARHLCAPVESIRPSEVFPGGRLDLLMAGPSCTHYSRARGGKPTSDQQRASPWHLIPWLEELRVENLLVENVWEITKWGPVGRDGKPIKRGEGKYFQDWIRVIQAHGYTVAWKKINSADFGDATTRHRFFLMARRGNKPIFWPIPTHSRHGEIPGTKPWKAAREIIDWSLKGTSIFERTEPLALNTMLRIIEGCRRFGPSWMEPFLQKMERDLRVPTPPKWIGRKVDPFPAEPQPFLIGMEHGGRVQSLDHPLPTITTAKGGAFGFANPFTVGVCGRNLAPYSTEDPLPTLTHRSTRWLIEAGERRLPPFTLSTDRGQTNRSKPVAIEDPIATVVGSVERLGLAEPFLLSQASGGAPRGVGGPVPTIPTGGAHALVDAGFILPPLGFHARDGKANVPRSPDEPLQTITSRGGGHVVEPFIVPNFGERPGQAPRVKSVKEPLNAVTSHGAGGLVEPFLTRYYSSGGRWSSVDAPMPTQTTKERIALVMPVIKNRALDIRFRMLIPRELSMAMGFSADYEFKGNRTEIVRQIGNAISVETARWLCRALLEGKAPRQTVLETGE